MPTVIDVAPIAAALAGLRLASPITHGAITVVPLLGRATTEPDWLTLVEAADVVTITEVSAHGAVPTLAISSKADRPVLLLDGEELVGAKQNRVLNTSVLVAAGLTATIPVSCVEHGRWNSVSHGFATSEVSLLASLRRRKAQRVSASLREGCGHVGDQREIWADLAESACRLGVASPTDAMHAMYDDHATDIEMIRNALGAIDQQVGALVYVAGRWAGLELLASPGLFRRAWSRLCAGYAVDALGGLAGEGVEPDADAVLALLARATAEPAPAVGLGEEYRLGGTVLGAALVADGRVAHLSAFPGADDRPGAHDR
jgi:hypothetical protein